MTKYIVDITARIVVPAVNADALEQLNKKMLEALKQSRSWLELFHRCAKCDGINKTDRQLNGLLYTLEFIIAKAETTPFTKANH